MKISEVKHTLCSLCHIFLKGVSLIITKEIRSEFFMGFLWVGRRVGSNVDSLGVCHCGRMTREDEKKKK